MATRVTLKEIAKELGLSVMTVSRALNNRSNVDEKTRNRILQTARRLGYRPNYVAKSLVLNKTNTLGVVVPEISHSFFPEVIRGIEEVAHQAGYQLILTHSKENAERELEVLNTLEAKRVDGILISMAQSSTDLEPYKERIASGIPLVFFDRCAFGLGASCVSINDEQSAETITRHLIEGHGYQKIAHLAGPQKLSIGIQRMQGFKKAMQDNGLDISEDWLQVAGLNEKGGLQAMRSLLALPDSQIPRAIVAVNDPVAFGAMQAIYEEGLRIPEDIAITGFTDDIRAQLMPAPLTTVRQPAFQVGQTAAKKLLEHIGDSSSQITEEIIEAGMVIRRSCGCKEVSRNIVFA